MQLRNSHLTRLGQTVFDALVVGGGINGAVSAAALSGKGVRTALIDRGDFAGFTSMQSSNLAWGGIKYMEGLEFALVRKLCMSRNRLIRSYPSTVQEIRFLTTVARGFRFHPTTLWLGAWVYWLIGGGFTRAPRRLQRRALQREEPIIDVRQALGGFEYSDAYLHDNDARFVFGFVRSALDRGCIAANYVESLGGRRVDGLWTIRARNRIDGTEFTIRARTLVNAAGPFVDEHNALTGQVTRHRHAFSKGVHLLVPRLTPNRRVLAFFADDGRLFFAIPMGARTCIGTTDTPTDSPHVEVTDEDVDFILGNINRRLRLDAPLRPTDIIATRCGVRPLAVKASEDVARGADFMQLSRKHVIESDAASNHCSIFGGKLTDCINVGDEVCAAVEAMGIRIPHPDHRWYGEPDDSVRREFLHRSKLMDLDGLTSPDSSEPLTSRLWRRYGGEAFGMLEAIREDPRQGEILIRGTEYIRCELQHAARREMITTLEDFLRRRSKIALVVEARALRESAGLMDACEILFGSGARDAFEAYFAPGGN